MTEITQVDVDAAIEWYSPRESEWQGLLAEHFARHRIAERTAIASWLRKQDEIAFQEWIKHASSEYDNKLARIAFQIEQGEYAQ